MDCSTEPKRYLGSNLLAWEAADQEGCPSQRAFVGMMSHNCPCWCPSNPIGCFLSLV